MLPKELLKDLQDVADILSDKMNGLDDTEEVEVPTVLHDGSEVKSIEEVAAIMGVQPYIAAVFTLQSTDVSSELAAEAKSIILEEKVIRRVRSIAGQNRFGQPIGSIIVRDAPLHWIRDALSGRPNGYYEDSEGDRYHVYKVSTGTSGDTWTWYATTNSDDRGVMYPSEEDALAALDRYVAAKPSTREVKPSQAEIDRPGSGVRVPPRPGRVAKKRSVPKAPPIYYRDHGGHGYRLIQRGPRHWYVEQQLATGEWAYTGNFPLDGTTFSTERRAREALQDYDPNVVLSGKPIDDGPTEFVLHHGVSGLDNDTRYDLTQNANGWIIRYKSPGTNNEWRVSLAGTFPTRQAAEETLHDLVPSDLYRMIHPHVREAEAGPISFVNEADSAVYKLADDENGYWHINGPGVDAERKYQTRDEAEAVLRQWFPRVRQVVKKTAKKRVTKRPAQPTKPLDFENDENEFHIAQRRDGKWIINMRTRGSRGAWDQVMRGTFARNDFDSHQEAVQTLKDDWGDIRVRDTSRVVKTAKKLTKKAAATPSNTYGLNPAVLDRLTPEGPPEDMVFRGSDGEKYRIRRDPDVAETADRPHWMVEKWYANVSGRTGGWVPNFISNFGTQQLAAERLNSALPERTAQPAFGVGSIRPLTDQQRRALESARALNVTDEEFMPLELDGDEYSNIMDVGDMWYRGRNGRFYTLRREGDTAQIRDEEGVLLSEFEDSGDAFDSLNKIAERWEDALMAPDDRAAKPVRPNRPSDFAVSVALGEKDPYAHLSLSERIGLAEWVNEAISGHESLASSSLGPGMVAGLRTNRVYRIFQAPEATDWMADTASNLTNANAGQYLDPFIRADTLSALVAQLDTEEAEPPSLFPIPDRENYYQGADSHEYVVRRDTRTNLWAAFRVEPDRSESQVGDFTTQRENAVHNAEWSAQGLESFQPTRNWQERRDRLTRLTGGVVSRLYRGSDDNFYKISPVTKKDGGGWRIEKRLGADNWEVHTNINFVSESVAADWLNEQMPQPTVPKNDMPDWANLNFTVVNRDSMTFTGSTGTLMRIVSDRGIWYAEAQREDNGTWFRVTIPDHHSPREVAEYINANQPSIVSPSAPKEADAYVLGTVDSRFNHLRLSGVNGLTTVDEQGVKYTGVHHQDGVNGDYWTLRIERPNGAFFLLPTDNTLTDVRHFPEWYDAMVWADEASGDLDAALMSNIAQTEGRPVTRNPPMVTSWYTGRHNYRVVDNGRGSNEWFAEVLVREGPRGKEVWAQAVPTRGVFASQAEATAALQGFDPTARSGRSTPSEPLPSPSAARTDQGPSAHPTRTDGSPYVHLTITDDSLVYMGTNGHRYRIDFNTDGALVQGEMEGVRPRHWPTLTRRYATIDEALEWADRRAAEGTTRTRLSTGIHPIDGSGTAYAGLSLTDNPLVFQGENGSKYKVDHEDDGYHVYIPSGDERGWISTTIGLATYDEAMHWANDRAIEITQWNRERQAREQNITMEEVENLLGPSSTNVVVNGVNMSFLTDIGDVTRNVFEDNNGHVYRVVAAGPDMGDPPRWHLYQDGALVATENSRDTAVEHANLLAQRGGDVSIVGHPMQGYPHLIVEGLRSDGVHEGGRFRTPVGTVFWVHYNTATEKYEVEKDGVLDSDHITYTEALEAAEAIAAAETPVPATNESPYQFYSFRGDERQYRLFSHYGSDGTVLWEIEEQGEEEDENGEIWHPIPMGAGFYTREGAEDALRRYDPSIQADTSVPATSELESDTSFTPYEFGGTTYENLDFEGHSFRGRNGRYYHLEQDPDNYTGWRVYSGTDPAIEEQTNVEVTLPTRDGAFRFANELAASVTRSNTQLPLRGHPTIGGAFIGRSGKVYKIVESSLGWQIMVRHENSWIREQHPEAVSFSDRASAVAALSDRVESAYDSQYLRYIGVDGNLYRLEWESSGRSSSGEWVAKKYSGGHWVDAGFPHRQDQNTAYNLLVSRADSVVGSPTSTDIYQHYNLNGVDYQIRPSDVPGELNLYRQTNGQWVPVLAPNNLPVVFSDREEIDRIAPTVLERIEEQSVEPSNTTPFVAYTFQGGTYANIELDPTHSIDEEGLYLRSRQGRQYHLVHGSGDVYEVYIDGSTTRAAISAYNTEALRWINRNAAEFDSQSRIETSAPAIVNGVTYENLVREGTGWAGSVSTERYRTRDGEVYAVGWNGPNVRWELYRETNDGYRLISSNPITPAVLLSSLNASNAFTPMQAGGITLRNLERMPDVEERFHAGSQVRDYTGTVYSLIQSGDDWQTVVYNADGSHRSMTSAGSAAEALAILNNHVPPAPEPASNAEPLPTPVKKTTGRRRGRQVRANGTVLKHIRRKGSTETYYGDDGSVYSITDTGLTGGWGHRRTYTVRGASNNFIQEVQGLPEAQRYLDSYIARGGGNDNAPLSGLSALIGQPISDGTYNFGQHGSMTVRRTNYYEDQYEVTVRTPQRNILLTLRKLPDGIWETRPYSDNDPHHAAQVDTAGSSVFEAIYLLNRELGDPDLPHGAQPSNIHFTPPEEIAPGVITEEQLKTGILSSGTYRMGEMTFDVSMSSYDSEQMNVVVHDPNGPENNRITLFRQYNTQRWQARDESTYRRTGDNLTSGAALYSVLTTRQRQIDARTRLFTGGYANLTVHAVDDGGTTIKADVLTEPFTIELGTNNEGEVTYTFTRVNRFTGPSFRQAMYARINQKKYTDVEQAIADIVEAINAPDPLEKARQLAHSGKKMKMKYPPSGGGSMNLDDPELDPEIVAWCIQAFEGEFGKGSLRTELKLGESSVSHDYFHIHGTILNDSGAIATFQRTINRRSKELHNDYLSLPDTVRGQGFAEEFYHHVEQYVAEGGIVNVTVNANINVGSYAWARRGFDITSSRSYAFSTLYDRLKRYRNNPPERFEFDLDEDGKVINTRTLPPVPFEEWQLALIDHFLKRLQEADPRLTMREIAGFSEDWYQWMGKTEEGRPLHLHLGKKIMLGGFSWDGRKDVLYGFEKKSDEFSEVETGEEYMARLMAFLPEAEKLFIPGDFYEDSVHNDYNVMFADLLLPPRTFPETKGW